MFDFHMGVPMKFASWGSLKHHFDEKYLANKGIDF
jgi:hypothetical protein